MTFNPKWRKQHKFVPFNKKDANKNDTKCPFFFSFFVVGV